MKRLSALMLLCALLLTAGCAKTINVRLDGVTDPVTEEVFGKIVGSAEGVVSAKRYSSSIHPGDPESSSTFWRASVSGIDGFYLQTEIMEMAKEVIRYGGSLNMLGVPYNYSESEIAMLLGLRPHDATTKEIRFIIDRELIRDREMSGW